MNRKMYEAMLMANQGITFHNTGFHERIIKKYLVAKKNGPFPDLYWLGLPKIMVPNIITYLKPTRLIQNIINQKFTMNCYGLSRGNSGQNNNSIVYRQEKVPGPVPSAGSETSAPEKAAVYNILSKQSYGRILRSGIYENRYISIINRPLNLQWGMYGIREYPMVNSLYTRIAAKNLQMKIKERLAPVQIENRPIFTFTGSADMNEMITAPLVAFINDGAIVQSINQRLSRNFVEQQLPAGIFENRFQSSIFRHINPDRSKHSAAEHLKIYAIRNRFDVENYPIETEQRLMPVHGVNRWGSPAVNLRGRSVTDNVNSLRKRNVDGKIAAQTDLKLEYGTFREKPPGDLAILTTFAPGEINEKPEQYLTNVSGNVQMVSAEVGAKETGRAVPLIPASVHEDTIIQKKLRTRTDTGWKDIPGEPVLQRLQSKVLENRFLSRIYRHINTVRRKYSTAGHLKIYSIRNNFDVENYSIKTEQRLTPVHGVNRWGSPAVNLRGRSVTDNVNSLRKRNVDEKIAAQTDLKLEHGIFREKPPGDLAILTNFTPGEINEKPEQFLTSVSGNVQTVSAEVGTEQTGRAFPLIPAPIHEYTIIQKKLRTRTNTGWKDIPGEPVLQKLRSKKPENRFLSRIYRHINPDRSKYSAVEHLKRYSIRNSFDVENYPIETEQRLTPVHGLNRWGFPAVNRRGRSVMENVNSLRMKNVDGKIVAQTDLKLEHGTFGEKPSGDLAILTTLAPGEINEKPERYLSSVSSNVRAVSADGGAKQIVRTAPLIPVPVDGYTIIQRKLRTRKDSGRINIPGEPVLQRQRLQSNLHFVREQSTKALPMLNIEGVDNIPELIGLKRAGAPENTVMNFEQALIKYRVPPEKSFSTMTGYSEGPMLQNLTPTVKADDHEKQISIPKLPLAETDKKQRESSLPPFNGKELDRLAERVFQVLEKKINQEKDRRGF